IAAGRGAEALAMAETASALNPRYPTMTSVLAHAHAVAGNTSRARTLLDDITSGGDYASGYYVAIAYAALGEIDRAFEALSRAVDQREWFVILLQQEPALDPLRGDVRFDALIQRVGLPVTSTTT